MLDTNVIVAAVRSKSGASFQLLERLLEGEYSIAVSAALVFEYEEVLVRETVPALLSLEEVDQLMRMICSIGAKYDPSTRSRPSQIDPDDDFLVDLAVAAKVDYLVTYNVRHMSGARRNDIAVATPGDFLRVLRGKS